MVAAGNNEKDNHIMSDTEAALDTGGKNRKPSLIAYQVRDGLPVADGQKTTLRWGRN
jgi:hypothetical protein